MDVSNEKSKEPVEDVASSKASTLQPSDEVATIEDKNQGSSDNPAPTMEDADYPHGLPLVLLAGASLIAVFLIALDQVSTYQTRLPMTHF